MKVHVIDTHYMERDRFAACYLVEIENRFCLIENNTAPLWPKIKSTLHQLGATQDNLDWNLITHIHLDHAGASGELAHDFPRTILGGHPRAIKHALNPEKLIKGATEVYGEKLFKKLYGKILPAHRAQSFEDGEVINWQGEEIHVLHTEGHARHHACFYFKRANICFTGDTFGVCYPSLQRGTAPFLFPSTSPTDFDPQAAVNSFNRLLSLQPQTYYPTHFGPVAFHPKLGDTLTNYINFCTHLLKNLETKNLPGEKLLQEIEFHLKNHLHNLAVQSEINLEDSDWELLSLDLKLNAQGLLWYYEKHLGQSK